MHTNTNAKMIVKFIVNFSLNEKVIILTIVITELRTKNANQYKHKARVFFIV